MSHADDEPDDAGLESLRSMFRSMPDDEPPARGLAELMAAARVKAEEMAQPTLWARFTALLRRPQVLALATIMLLVGGAVFISQRRDTLEAQSPAVAQEAAPSMGSAMAGDEGRPLEDDLEPTGVTRPAVAPPMDPAAAAPAAAPVLSRTGAVSSRPTAVVAGGTKKSVAAPPRKSAPKMPAPELDGDDRSRDLADKSGATLAEESEAASPNAQGKRDGAGPPLTAKQLHTQALAAAAQNNCARVRILTKQIAQQDAPYYRANIAPDRALATCLN